MMIAVQSAFRGFTFCPIPTFCHPQLVPFQYFNHFFSFSSLHRSTHHSMLIIRRRLDRLLFDKEHTTVLRCNLLCFFACRVSFFGLHFFSLSFIGVGAVLQKKYNKIKNSFGSGRVCKFCFSPIIRRCRRRRLPKLKRGETQKKCIFENNFIAAVAVERSHHCRRRQSFLDIV